MKKLFSYSEGKSRFEILMNGTIYRVIKFVLIVFVLHDLVMGGTERWFVAPLVKLHEFVSSFAARICFLFLCVIISMRWFYHYLNLNDDEASPPIAIRKIKTDDNCH